MNEKAHQPAGDLSARVTAMEEIAMHQDRVIQQLHEVLLQQDRRLASVEASLARLTGQLRTFYESLDEPPPPDEKPPHY